MRQEATRARGGRDLRGVGRAARLNIPGAGARPLTSSTHGRFARIATSLTAVTLGALALIATPSIAQQVGHAPLEIRTGAPPTALFALGRAQLVYELHLTNFGIEPVGIVALEVTDSAGRSLGKFGGPSLAARTVHVGASAPAGSGSTPAKLLEVLNIAPGERVVSYLWITLPPGQQLPESIHHTVITGTSTSQDTTLVENVQVMTLVSPLLEPPVASGTWVAIRGPSNSSGHRLSIVTAGGQATIPQRYAVDWAMLGPDGKLFSGDSTRLENWYGYGTAVRSAAAGVVVWAHDGEAEHPAMRYAAPAVIEASSAMGNAIIVDIGNGHFATYAHLQPKSLRVRVGDRVTAAQPLGALGNSGNTLAPHLHFHVSSAPGPLAGEGLPYRLTGFELIGRVQAAGRLLGGGAWTAMDNQPARAVTAETPLENMVVRFGPP